MEEAIEAPYLGHAEQAVGSSWNGLFPQQTYLDGMYTL